MKTTDHYLYATWKNMRQRCNNPNNHKYSYYGARGIEVCSRWNDFWNFVADMGERPEGHSIDRIDNDKGYHPDNCRWATSEQQNNNKRMREDNKTGVRGISLYKGKYLAQCEGKFIGLYSTLEEANKALENYKATGEIIKEERLMSTNKTGVRGVCFHKGAGKYQAQYKGKYLGSYATIEQASEALEVYKQTQETC